MLRVCITWFCLRPGEDIKVLWQLCRTSSQYASHMSARGLKLVISDAFVPVFLQFCLRVGANVKRRAYFSDVSKIAHLLHPEARLSIYYSPVFESNRCLLPATSVD